MAVRIWTAVVAAGCFRAPPPPPPISNAGGPAPRSAPRTLEIWEGTGYQPDAESTWTIELRIRRDAAVGAQLGTIEYPSLGCAGELIRAPDRGTTIVATERLTVNTESACVDGGTIVLRDAGDLLDWRWYYTNGEEGATSTLRRKPPP